VPYHVKLNCACSGSKRSPIRPNNPGAGLLYRPKPNQINSGYQNLHYAPHPSADTSYYNITYTHVVANSDTTKKNSYNVQALLGKK
jgi:hypothetical protein